MKDLNIDKKILNSLRLALEKQLFIFAWNIDSNEELTKVPLEMNSIETSKNKLTCSLIEDDTKAFEEMITGEGRLKFYIPEFALAFECEIINLNNFEELSLCLPKLYKFYDRRDDKRFEVISNIQLKIPSEKTSYISKCDDISMGGCSIFINKNLFLNIKKEDLIEGCELIIDHTKIIINVKIVNIKRLNAYENEKMPYANRRIAFSFTSLSSKEQLVLQNVLSTQKKILEELIK